MSQVDIVRNILQTKGEITGQEAWELGIKNLKAVIYSLRDEFDITTISNGDDTFYIDVDFNEKVVFENRKTTQN